jgi:hypothetical protein
VKRLTPVSEILPAIVKPEMRPLSRIEERLLSMPADDEDSAILYQHSVLCQTSMPYRNPGDDVRIWQRKNGRIRMELLGGRVLDPNIDQVIDVGLPFGPKPRLVLYHLNAEAMRTQSPIIELEDSLTAFVKRTLKLDTSGKTIRPVKEQLNRLAAADFRFYASYDGHAVTVKGSVIDGLELWISKDYRQRVLWPSVIQFSQRYFESLLAHAVPLREADIARLSHSAMGLDVYTWLAQRLHRIDPAKPALVPWTSLQEQFGQGYDRLRDFRRVFLRTLKQVHTVYREAKFAVDEKGMRLLNSPPPVTRRFVQIK